MEFDLDALRGILAALPYQDLQNVRYVCKERGVSNHAYLSEDRRKLVEQVLIDLGHIVVYNPPITEAGAEEYEEIMQAEQLMQG